MGVKVPGEVELLVQLVAVTVMVCFDWVTVTFTTPKVENDTTPQTYPDTGVQMLPPEAAPNPWKTPSPNSAITTTEMISIIHAWVVMYSIADCDSILDFEPRLDLVFFTMPSHNSRNQTILILP